MKLYEYCLSELYRLLPDWDDLGLNLARPLLYGLSRCWTTPSEDVLLHKNPRPPA